MITKYFIVGAIATALMTGTALSQTPAPANRTDSNAAAMDQSYKGQWRLYKMIGLDVYNQNNEKLGDIAEFLTDQNGKIKTVSCAMWCHFVVALPRRHRNDTREQ